MLTVLGRRSSINVQKVLWTLDELGLPFEQLDRGGEFGGLDDPSYRRLNPNGLVPTLVDGDMAIWESNSIVRHLVRRYGQEVFPEDEKATLADMWMDWQITVFWPALRPLFLQLTRTPPDHRDQALISSQREMVCNALRILDHWLDSREYLCGSRFSIGDIAVGVTAHRWFALEVDHIDLRATRVWYDRMAQRPAFQRRVMIPRG